MIFPQTGCLHSCADSQTIDFAAFELAWGCRAWKAQTRDFHFDFDPVDGLVRGACQGDMGDFPELHQILLETLCVSSFDKVSMMPVKLSHIMSVHRSDRRSDLFGTNSRVWTLVGEDRSTKARQPKLFKSAENTFEFCYWILRTFVGLGLD